MYRNSRYLYIVLGLLVFFSCKNERIVTKKRPNIVFILVDDLGLMDLGFTGSTYYETPNVDLLASEGMVFTQGYATSRVCSPSRASIMTGQFTATHGITDWIGARTGTEWRKNKRHDLLLPATYNHQLGMLGLLKYPVSNCFANTV